MPPVLFAEQMLVSPLKPFFPLHFSGFQNRLVQKKRKKKKPKKLPHPVAQADLDTRMIMFNFMRKQDLSNTGIEPDCDMILS